jgi:hypothetical protein
MAGIQVNSADHNCLNACSNDLVGASPGASNGGTRFERQIQCRSTRDSASRPSKAFDLSVWTARFPMVSARNDLIGGDEHCADGGIRTCSSQSFSRFS